MSKITLYRLEPHHGVVALMTEDAYEAFKEIRTRYAEYDSYDLLDADVWIPIAACTMTFVKAHRFYYPSGQFLHTGTFDTLDLLQEKCEVVPIPVGKSFVPFSSGNNDSYRRELEKGFGPKPALLQSILDAVTGDEPTD